MFADFILLSDDYFSVPESKIKDLSAVLTVVGGNVVFGDKEFARLSPAIEKAIPDWSPVNFYGGYQKK